MTPLEEKMAALRVRFVERTRTDHVAITEAAGDVIDADRLRRLAHSIAGSAGLFGFGTIGEEARQLEEAIDEGADATTTRSLAARLAASLVSLG